MKIRRALPIETLSLSSLAFRSKKVWGYNSDFMDQCRQELIVSSEYIASNHVYVLEDDGQTMGFYLAMGAKLKGEVSSNSIPGRTLPLLCYTILISKGNVDVKMNVKVRQETEEGYKLSEIVVEKAFKGAEHSDHKVTPMPLSLALE